MPRPITYSDGLLEGYLAQRRADTASRLVPEPLRRGSALDIGCGCTPLFLLQTAFSRKVGIDKTFAGAMQLPGVELCAIDLHKTQFIPFEDRSFSVVALLASIEHFPRESLVNILKEARRLLKTPGRLIITTPAPWADPLLRILARLRIVSAKGMAEHQATYGRREIAAHLNQAGFDIRLLRFGYFELGLNSWIFVDT